MPEKPKGPTDPALHPEWVHDAGGTLVPYRSPASIEAERIENERIGREKAANHGPVAGHDPAHDQDEGR